MQLRLKGVCFVLVSLYAWLLINCMCMCISTYDRSRKVNVCGRTLMCVVECVCEQPWRVQLPDTQFPPPCSLAADPLIPFSFAPYHPNYPRKSKIQISLQVWASQARKGYALIGSRRPRVPPPGSAVGSRAAAGQCDESQLAERKVAAEGDPRALSLSSLQLPFSLSPAVRSLLFGRTRPLGAGGGRRPRERRNARRMKMICMTIVVENQIL